MNSHQVKIFVISGLSSHDQDLLRSFRTNSFDMSNSLLFPSKTVPKTRLTIKSFEFVELKQSSSLRVLSTVTIMLDRKREMDCFKLYPFIYGLINFSKLYPTFFKLRCILYERNLRRDKNN